MQFCCINCFFSVAYCDLEISAGKYVLGTVNLKGLLLNFICEYLQPLHSIADTY